jgi:hypothetical protein
MRDSADRYLRLLEAFRDSAVLKRFPAERKHLGEYVATLRAQHRASFPEDVAAEMEKHIYKAQGTNGEAKAAEADKKVETKLESALFEGEAQYDRVPAKTATRFNEVYTATKSCNVVNVIVATCSTLVKYKRFLRDPADLKDKFLVQYAGLSFSPFQGLPQFNFKHLYVSLAAAEDKRFVMTVMHKMFAISHDVYEAASAPDVNLDELKSVVLGSIGDVKKMIPRCDEAFTKIADSVDLLKSNFGGYYKDYMASNNPTIIMENFVLDVSKKTDSSPRVTAQFRKIIAHYRKLSSQQASHPKLQALFHQVDKNFQELEKGDRAADAKDENEEPEEPEAEPSESKAAPAKSKAAKKNQKRRDAKKNAKKPGVAPAADEPSPAADEPSPAEPAPVAATEPAPEPAPESADVPQEVPTDAEAA